jgi:hypothetical protein
MDCSSSRVKLLSAEVFLGKSKNALQPVLGSFSLVFFLGCIPLGLVASKAFLTTTTAHFCGWRSSGFRKFFLFFVNVPMHGIGTVLTGTA